ncbi:DNA-protecting protein DprA [Deferribacter autotrophicus]|uniref:DNA-protecting protein DprA n=1 Tax=Deferribacter autotrophicus TaxID=500465 RepID=A0A5A8F3B0_9BACT|nr:DNA-processing protein DprA [Deferribacter autotrophicus]KAA0258338.1 DNA-protecting protein DprA [Deferribacter autotrophicus]
MVSKETVKNYLLLKTIKGISDNIIFTLYKKYTSLSGIFEVDKANLAEVVGERTASLIDLKNADVDFVNNELEKTKKYSIKIITLEDDFYPSLLKEINSPPAYLYCLGDYETLKMPSIAIVGSRKATKKAVNFTMKLAQDLAELGLNIVSGFAAGIDIAAHLGAIKKGKTTAVFGNGFLYVYPESNKKYFKEIIKKGCIITEFSLDTKPDAYNFPRRNRIIAGMSYGVIVVEAAEKSGSLITASLAMEENREVFAVPIWPEEKNNGTNKLIKEGAKLIENYYDVVEELVKYVDSLKMIDKKINDNNINFNDDFEKVLYQLIAESPKSIDEICIETGKELVEIMNKLSEMELKGLLSLDIDGKYYARRV